MQSSGIKSEWAVEIWRGEKHRTEVTQREGGNFFFKSEVILCYDGDEISTTTTAQQLYSPTYYEDSLHIPIIRSIHKGIPTNKNGTEY